MKLEVEKVPKTNETVYKITVSPIDLLTVLLDRWDHAMIREAEKSNRISDVLLLLELLARKLELVEEKKRKRLLRHQPGNRRSICMRQPSRKEMERRRR